jgi:hypothetical protein
MPDGARAEHPRLDELLSTWADWQRSDQLRDLDVQTSSFWADSHSDFEQMVEHCDARDARAVDAAVWDLSPVERAAVLHRHSAAVWRTQREPLAEAYARARRALSDSLRRRSVP